MNDQGINDLCIAIIKQACEDYEAALNGGDIRGKVGGMDAVDRVNECERFFRSTLCDSYSGGVNGESIIKVCQIRAKYTAWRKEKDCSKCKNKTCVHKSGEHFTLIEKGHLYCEKEVNNGGRKKS